ncbi:hypothetical protein BC941DRAFT_430369 [Chlamydoabsidia padenii]|nr:hypothetical protein BC941DRAFT_430369 [Chlamydoabsidia padenii]
MTNTDDEYIEETSYVIMDLTAYHTEEAIRSMTKETGGMAITNLMDSPIYTQLGPETYMGELDDPIGSYLLFELEEKKTDTSSLLPMLSSMQQTYREDQDDPRQQQHQQTKWQASYRFQADKIVKSKQVKLGPKDTPDDQEENDEEDQPAHFEPGTSMASFLKS